MEWTGWAFIMKNMRGAEDDGGHSGTELRLAILLRCMSPVVADTVAKVRNRPMTIFPPKDTDQRPPTADL